MCGGPIRRESQFITARRIRLASICRLPRAISSERFFRAAISANSNCRADEDSPCAICRCMAVIEECGRSPSSEIGWTRRESVDRRCRRLNMNRVVRRFVLFACLVFFCAAAENESGAQSSSLTAFYTAPVVSMAPMWIAKEAGFFKKQGLDVRLVFIASGPLGTTSILSGDVDVGVIGGFAPIRAIAGGARNLVIIGQTKNRMTGSIVGKKEIATVQDLKGKRLGIDRVGSNPDMFTQASLARFNMDPLKDLNYIQLGTIGQGVPALKAGTIDAVTTNPPHDLFAQRLGFKVILDITALKIPFAATVLLSARNTVERKQAEL